MERNKHYTSDSLRRVAAQLGVALADFFLPPELLRYRSLPREDQLRIAALVDDIATARGLP